jgi:serine/threonine protein kinase
MMPVESANLEQCALGPRKVVVLTKGASSAPVKPSVLPRRRPPESASKTVLMDWAYDEYYRLLEEGEQPDIHEFCARFPRCRSALLRMLDFAEYIGDNPQYLDGKNRTDQPIAWPIEGEKRGDWTIVRELGRGSFARVFLAREASTGDRPVAVKFSRHSGAEAQTLGRLAHAHIVPILSARPEESTGLTAICMPYLGSTTLEDVRDGIPTARPRRAALLLDVLRAYAQPEDPPAGPIDPRLQKGTFADGVIHLAIQLAEALAFLHDRGFCHRDLKPSNVLLDPSGKPLLLDFNLSVRERKSVPVGGTLRYMAPEQLRAYVDEDYHEPDGRADLFALAVIVWELLTGEHPCGPHASKLNGRPLAEFLLERIPAGFPSLKRLCPGIEKPVAAILERCLAADPVERPNSAAELASELKRQFTPARRLRRWIVARPRLTLTALVFFALAAATAGYTLPVAPLRGEREYGRYEEAEQHFDHAVQSEPDNPRWRRGRDSILERKAYLQARQQNTREALMIYAQLASSGPLSAAQLNNRAYCCTQLAGGPDSAKLLAQAEADLDAAAALTTDYQAIYYNRATIALRKGVASWQSLEDIERAVQLGPATPPLYRDAALLYGQAADLRRAPVLLDAPIATALFLEARPRRIERALYYARESIALGQPPRQFVLFKDLLPRPVFRDLQRMQPGPATTSAELRLIDPADNLD